MSFEAIALNLVDQDDFETLEIVGEDITMRAERVSWEYNKFPRCRNIEKVASNKAEYYFALL